MAESTLQVFMDGTFCGKILQTASGDIRFVYDEGYRSDPCATPLSVSMPLTVAEYRKRVILPFLEGLITDSEQERQAVPERRKHESGELNYKQLTSLPPEEPSP